MTEEEDKEEERDTIKRTLESYGCPRWTMRKSHRKHEGQRAKRGNIDEKEAQNRGMVVLPYIK